MVLGLKPVIHIIVLFQPFHPGNVIRPLIRGQFDRYRYFVWVRVRVRVR